MASCRWFGNIYTGIKGVDEDIIMAARGMGSTDFQIMMKIKLPLALGVIIAGVRIWSL